MNSFFPELMLTISRTQGREVPHVRKMVLQPLIHYIQDKMDAEEEVHLNFICTNNSRRSQFAQVWGQTAANHFGLPVKCFSGGVEVTACNERTIASLKRMGFRVRAGEGTNPVYSIYYSDDSRPIRAFSKLFDDKENRVGKFAAVMTCADADENCPFIPGTEKRISVRYEDPKEFDDTPLEAKKYDERCHQIAAEMFYVFSRIKFSGWKQNQ